MPFDVLEPETTSQGYELLEPENKGYEIIEPEVGIGQVDLSHTKGPLEEAPPSPPKPSYSLGDYAKAGLQILDLPRFKVSQIPEAVRQFQAEPAINYQIPPVEQVKPTIAERLAIPPAIQQIVGPENAAQIGRTLVNIPLGVGEFLTTSPMGITTMASARTIPGITGAYFFQDMARSFATQAAQTYKDWDKMSTPQKIDATLKVASSALLAGALGVHTAGRIKQVVSGEPAAPAPNTEQTAGIGGNVHPVLGAEVLGWPRLVETVRSLFSVPVGEKKTAAIVPPLVEQQQSLPLHTQQQQPEEGVLNAESIRASEGQLPQTRVEPQGIQEAGGNVVEQKPPGQPEPMVQGGQPQAQSEVLLTPEAKPSPLISEKAPEAPAPSAAVGESGTGVVEQPATQPPAISEAKPLVENTQVAPSEAGVQTRVVPLNPEAKTLLDAVPKDISRFTGNHHLLNEALRSSEPPLATVEGKTYRIIIVRDRGVGFGPGIIVLEAKNKPGFPVAGGSWMDQWEPYMKIKYGISKADYSKLPIEKRAEIEAKRQSEYYYENPKKDTFPEAFARTYHPVEWDAWIEANPTKDKLGRKTPAFWSNKGIKYWKQKYLSEPTSAQPNSSATTEIVGTPMPPEQSIGGALPEEITKPGTYVSNMFAAIDRDRAEMGKPPMEATKRRTWDEDNAKALARMNKDPEWIPNLLAAMTVEPRPMLSWEIAGTVWQRAKWKAEIHNAERSIELAIKDNRPTDLAEAQEVRKKFEGAIELLDQTVGRNGTASEAGRSLRAQRMATGEDFDLVELRLKRVADKGRQLTDAEVKETEEKVAKPYKKVTEKLAETEEKAQEAKDENGFKDTVEKVKQERPRPEDNVKSLQTKLGERLTEDPEYDIYPIVKRLVKVLIDTEGITTREPMYDRVHQILQEVIPNLTRREVIDAVGGYNRPIDLPMDVVSVIYRDLRGQSQQVSKLADMAKGEAPKRTGLQRGEMSDEQRRLVKQVEEAKRLGGYKVTDPARQLRTALQAAKTAVEHQIADLSKEIATKERILKTKTQMVPDQELLELRAKRDALKAEHKAIFGERVLTPEQKAKMAEAALDRQIAEVQRQLETGEVFPPTRTPAPMPSTPGIEAKLQTLAELKLQRYYERERIQPSRTPEVQAVNKLHAAMKAAETRLVNQITSLESQLAKRVKNVRPARVVIENAKIVELRARIADLKKTYDAVFRPPPYTDAKRLEIWKERTQDKIESYKKRIEEKDLARKPRPQEPNLDREAMDLRFELEKVHRVWMEMRAQDMLEKQTKLQKAIRHTIDTSNSVRALMTSFDLSAVLRQGKFIVAGHPIRGAKSFIPMLQAMWSPEAQYRINAEIRRRPNAPLYDRAGLYLAEHGGRLVQAEEAFMAKGIEKVPIVGRGVLASGRAYTTFLNKLRADSFDIMAKTLSKSGDVTLDEAKAIANYINVATGRGAGFQQGAAGLNAVFFAPRFVASRFQALALQPLWKGDWRTRKLIAKEYARFATGIAVVYALGLAAGATVETDRRSSDFGKLKFGNTRVDPLAGLGQVAVLTKRLLGGETKTLKGKVQPIRGPNVPYGGTTTMDVAGRFVRSKLNPTAGIAANLITQSDIIGRPLTVGGMVGGVFPIGWQDTLSAIKENGIPAGTALGVLSLLGEGVQVYNEEPKPAKR